MVVELIGFLLIAFEGTGEMVQGLYTTDLLGWVGD